MAGNESGLFLKYKKQRKRFSWFRNQEKQILKRFCLKLEKERKFSNRDFFFFGLEELE